MKNKNLTLEELTKTINSYFKDNPKQSEGIFPQHFTGQNEDGIRYSYWKIGDLITGDSGKIMYDEALKRAGELYLENWNKCHEK